MLLHALALVAATFPAPFHRTLEHDQAKPLRGPDVTILQQLLRRIPGKCALACGCGCSHVYDEATSSAVACFANRSHGTFDEDVARKVLASLSDDKWSDDGTPANASGHLYKVLIPVHRNRSIETMATLLDAHNNVLLRFRVRAHGHDADASGQPISNRTWPDLRDDGCPDGASAHGCVGLNEFSSNGNTPTGLSEIDLNSPEDSAMLYGPYPVNRFVRGLAGNAQFLISPEVCGDKKNAAASVPPHAAAPAAAPIRSGILMHTGAWAAHSSWTPGQPMPNSAGCVHAYPDAIKAIWQRLRALGVAVRNNTEGRLPYPYVPQGLAAVYQVGDDDLAMEAEGMALEGVAAQELAAMQEVAAEPVAAARKGTTAAEDTTGSASQALARQWVFGNHSGGSAFEICAIGSRGCMSGPVEPIDVAAENAAAESRLARLPMASRHILILPGRTPNGTPIPYRMNADERGRVAHATSYLNESGAALILASGGNVHPNLTPFNEAYQMKQALAREFGVPRDRIVIDPYARHSTTNLRNAGRFMLAFNVSYATIVTDVPQTFLFSHPELSLFNHQCKKTLGYVVGDLRPAGGLERTHFVPAPEVWTRDESEPRDP